MEDDDGEAVVSEHETDKKKTISKKKGGKAGIIYLSRLPPMMNVKHVRQIFSQYGDVGRIFLQPDEKKIPGNKKNQNFSEGWIEFTQKRVAKKVAASLNNTQIGGKRRSRWYEERWNLKYLHRFKWTHLNERLAYERAVHQQRMRTEIAQVKKETAHYIQNVEKNERLKKMKKKNKSGDGVLAKTDEWDYKQKETEEEILKKRKLESAESVGPKKRTKTEDEKKPKLSKSFLKGLFSGGVAEEEDET